MEALQIWRQNHEELKDLLNQAEDAEGKERKEILKQIKKALETDAQIVKTMVAAGMEKREYLLDNLVAEEDKQINALVLEINNLVLKLKLLKEIAVHHVVDGDI